MTTMTAAAMLAALRAIRPEVRDLDVVAIDRETAYDFGLTLEAGDRRVIRVTEEELRGYWAAIDAQAPEGSTP